MCVVTVAVLSTWTMELATVMPVSTWCCRMNNAFVMQVATSLMKMELVFVTLHLGSSFNWISVYVMKRPTSLRRMGNVFVMPASTL